jgi:type I restriction enzyme R subunit
MKTYSRHDFTREERAARAKVAISAAFESKEQAFLDFVLSHYVRVGVQELDQEKLTPLLRLKYNNSIADAVAHLGKPEDIGRVFIGFQKYLYQQEARSAGTPLNRALGRVQLSLRATASRVASS